jgi:superfamily II DNA or RNA helicase
MKTLFPKQSDAKEFFICCHKYGVNTLDSSSVGTGKTVVAVHLARDLGKPVAVLCPKAVIPSWEREFKAHGITPLFVTNFEKIRGGKTKWMSKAGKKIMRWSLPADTLVLVDEIHKCKGPYTLNAQLVIALVQQKYAVHGMSATAAEDPTEMRALGYLLGLHSLNKPENGLTSWYSWMMKYGCYQDDWGGWKLATKTKLAPLRHTMYGVNCNKLTPADFPDSFRDNRVFVEPTEFKDLKKIDKAYEQLGLTPAIIDEYILNGTVANSEHVLVNILKARQLAESFKVPDIAEIAEDFIGGGNSVVIFVNFTDSLNALIGLLHCPKIDGNQTANQRQQAIDDFQSDKANCIVVNIAAGGTGLSLHDINGVRPRISLICPTFNAKDYLQVLGRIHRNGAKSDALQKVLVAAGTIEEHVMKAIRIKTGNLEAIHGA